MATITSTATGLWAAGGTWVGGIAPGNGDTAIIATGHVVTIADGTTVTVGTSGPTGTVALTTQGTGRLAIGTVTGARLNCRGDFLRSNTGASWNAGFYALTMAPGSILEFDASQATTPLSQFYVCAPTASALPNTRILINGTSGSHCIVRSNAGGGNAWFSNGGFNSKLGSQTVTYCDFVNIGDGTNDAFQVYLSSDDVFDHSNCTYTSCGRIFGPNNIHAAAHFSLADCKWITSLATGELVQISTNAAMDAGSGGVRSVVRCSFDKLFGNSGSAPLWIDFSFYRNVFAGLSGAFYSTYSATGQIAQFEDNILVRTGSSVTPPINCANVKNCYVVQNDNAGNSKLCNASTLFDQTFDGLIWEGSGTDSTGDFISVTGAPSALRTILAQNCLLLPNTTGGERMGTLFSQATSSANWAIKAEHNTWMAGTESAISTSETQASAAGTIASYKSNFVWNNGGGSGGFGPYHIHDIAVGGTHTTDILAAGNCLNNAAGPGVLAGLAGKGLNLTMSVPPGATNLTGVSPGFVDSSRRLATWDASLGGAGTIAAALARLVADPTLIPTMRTWVRGGFAPTATALHGTAHDGGDIGAVAWQAAAGGSGSNSGRMTCGLSLGF